MEVLNYKSEIKQTLFAYLRNKTQINPKQLEEVYTALVNNDGYLNFSEEKSAKIKLRPNLIIHSVSILSRQSVLFRIT